MPVKQSCVPRPLTAEEKRALRPYIPEADLECARILDGFVPRYLPRRYIGIARGNHIYFRRGAYIAGTAKGLALLGHELVHVGQYRCGATWLSFLLSYLRHGYRDSPLEVVARETQELIARDLQDRTQCGADSLAAPRHAAAPDQ
jgi:hypothetical protein